MIKQGDYILIDEAVCKVVFPGRDNKTIRNISVKFLSPKVLDQIFSITVNVNEITILTEAQAKAVRCFYENR